MDNPSYYVRLAYKTALTNTIFYLGNAIPCYEAIPDRTNPGSYIRIASVNDSSVNNDSKFISEMNVELEIVSRQYKFQDNKQVEDICTSILEIIIPTIGGGIAIGKFDCGHIYVEGTRTLYEVDEQGYYITRKLLSLKHLVTQIED